MTAAYEPFPGPADPQFQPGTGELDLEDRHALRRVAGLSTELQDVTEVEYRALRLERVVLMGVWTEGTLASAENSLRELSLLAETAGSEVLDGLIQRRSRPDAATYVGSGKVAELAGIVAGSGADTVICDGELTPGQLRKLEGVVKVKVIDRTALILDIFAQHARSKEGKAQVELAQLQYLLPRLRGWGESLSRQAGGRVAGGGGIGTRGPGETKIETDRRRIRARIAKLRHELADVDVGREVQRGQRRRAQVPSVAIAGYTNAGKSSLLNRLTGAGRAGRGLAVRDPGPDGPPGPHPGGPAVHADRHRRVRPAPAAPAGRGVPLDAGGGRGRRPDPARGRRLRRRPGGAARRGPRGARRDRRGRRARARRHQQGRRGRPGRGGRAAPDEKGAVVVSARTGAGLDELRTELDRMLPRRDTEVACWCRTTAVTWSPGRTHEGEVLAVAHGQDGTELTARVPAGARRRAFAGGPAGGRDRRPRGCRGRSAFVTGQERIPPQRPVIRAGTAMSRPGGI